MLGKGRRSLFEDLHRIEGVLDLIHVVYLIGLMGVELLLKMFYNIVLWQYSLVLIVELIDGLNFQ